MPEHSPAPMPHRAVYGFAFYLLFLTLFTCYVIWALVPTFILEDKLSLYYLPDKYFALYVPILVLCATTIFAFFIYPSINLAMTPDINAEATIRDNYTVHRCDFVDETGVQCDNQLEKISEEPESPWKVRKFCSKHDEKFITREMKNSDKDTAGKDDICEYCSSKHISVHLQAVQLKRCPKIPAVRDLDLQDACKLVFK